MKNLRMFQRPLKLFGMLVFLSVMASCQFVDGRTIKGNGDLVSQDYLIDNFQILDLSGSFHVILSRGDQPSLHIETDENLHDYLRIEVKQGKLSLSTDQSVILRPSRMEVHITYTELSEINISGVCKLSAFETLYADKLRIELSGAADIDLDVQARQLYTRISGAGNIQLTGQADDHQIQLPGASHLRAGELITETTRISLSGAGSANVHATELLDAEISGVGKINYQGEPANKRIRTSGLGSVSPA